MTIPATSRVSPIYQGNASATTFAFGYKTYAKGELQVIVSDGVTPVTLTLDSDYSVALNADQVTSPGGTITYPISGAPLAIGLSLVIVSAVPNEQDVSLPTGGQFNAANVELGLDRLQVQLQQFSDTLYRTIRIPVGETLSATLPAALVRANYVLGFNSVGDPTAVVLANGSAGSLALDLVNSIVAAKGAGQIGYGSTLTYGANTVGLALHQLGVPLSKYGTVHNDGVTDDSATCIAAAASGAAVIDARGLNLRISSTINIPSNQTWLLQGTTISLTGTTLKVFSAVNVDNWNLVGPFKVVGDGSTAGTAYGVFVSNCTKWRVIDPTFANIRGWGMWNDPGASTRARGDGGSVINPVFYGCYVGWQDAAGTGAEFCSIVNLRAISNTSYGVVTCAGNTIFTGGHIVDNLAVGMLVTSGANAAHGMATGLNINHNGTFGLQCSQVLNGMTFTGCHFYQSSIWLDRSAGINISGGHLDCIVYNYKDGSSGMNLIENMYCPGGYGVCRQAGANNGHDQLIIRHCYGPGVYSIAGGGVDTTGVTINDPATCYAGAQRDAGTTQALTSGVAATLSWVSSAFPDRRGVLTVASGTFTVPANQAGLYHFDLDYLFGGTAMSATASFVELKVNGTSRKIFFPAIFGTTKLQVQGSVDLYLAAGDVVTTVGTITGTTPTFGDGSWPSSFEARRLA